MQQDQKEHPRRIQTVTTLALGDIDQDEVDVALGDSYDVPLWKFLFEDMDYEGSPDVDIFVKPCGHWLDRRRELQDIAKVDPLLREMVSRAIDLHHEHTVLEKKLADGKTDMEHNTHKLEVAAKTMITKQRMMIEDSGNNDPENSDLFKMHVKNITTWRQNKVDVMAKALEVIMNQRDRVCQLLDYHVRKIIEQSYMHYLKEKMPDPAAEVADADLMMELEEVMDSFQNLSLKAWSYELPSLTCPCQLLAGLVSSS